MDTDYIHASPTEQSSLIGWFTSWNVGLKEDFPWWRADKPKSSLFYVFMVAK
jgi:hypothetical protein